MTGFTPEAVGFLRELAEHNDRSWFAANRDRYESGPKAQMHGYLAALVEPLAERVPELEVRPDRIFRIHRDVRFSKNKAPYKTNIAAQLTARGPFEKDHTPGAYLHIEPGEVYIGLGLYEPSRDQLQLIRRAIADEPDAFRAIVEAPGFRERFGELYGEKLSRAPQGYGPDHPMIEYLRHKRFFVGRSLPESAAYGSALIDTTLDTLTAARPLLTWLLDTLTDGADRG